MYIIHTCTCVHIHIYLPPWCKISKQRSIFLHVSSVYMHIVHVHVNIYEYTALCYYLYVSLYIYLGEHTQDTLTVLSAERLPVATADITACRTRDRVSRGSWNGTGAHLVHSLFPLCYHLSLYVHYTLYVHISVTCA